MIFLIKIRSVNVFFSLPLWVPSHGQATTKYASYIISILRSSRKQKSSVSGAASTKIEALDIIIKLLPSFLLLLLDLKDVTGTCRGAYFLLHLLETENTFLANVFLLSTATAKQSIEV